MNKIPVLAVVGPTASGKTELGIKIAAAFGGEIISADSMQVYKGMDIATAKPTNEERSVIPHHLVDFLHPEESFSVSEYVLLAKRAADDITSREKIPVIVGGTGLYVNSFLDNTTFGEGDCSPVYRDQLSEEYDRMGGEVLLERLRGIDPRSAEKLHTNDKKRIIRALEVFYTTGQKKSERDKLAISNDSPYLPTFIGLRFLKRELLYERINSRVDNMVDMGLVEEARREFKSSKSKTSAQAIGHKELLPYFEGELSLDVALEKLKRETRRYAKRQMTWFAKNDRINWINCDGKDINSIFEEARVVINKDGFKEVK